ncbi:MAG: formimidoylglutamase [Deltaproteobacteria bacterium]|nr:formimidoylglutamase [Deltaproteobacteria bacterium]
MKKSSPPVSSRVIPCHPAARPRDPTFSRERLRLDPAVKPRDDRPVKVCPQIDYLEHYNRKDPVKFDRPSFACAENPWQGRDDGQGPERLHQLVQCVSLFKLREAPPPRFGIVGFCTDEGVRRNKGRPGARSGPHHLRKALANLCFPDSGRQILDVGDITVKHRHLEEAQNKLGNVVNSLLEWNITPLVLGGGHEIAWGHFQGLTPHLGGSSLLIINFDAHYDLRPLVKGRGNSGTSFAQIAEYCRAHAQVFRYLCIGLQEGANTKSLRKNADAWGVESIWARDIHLNSPDPLTKIKQAVAAADKVYLTICLDVFAQAFAPGVSAPQALGLHPWQVSPLMEPILTSGKLLSFDIAELCPPLDIDQRTAKLAAALVRDVLRQ